jgi:CSLREA domain-containing protein
VAGACDVGAVEGSSPAVAPLSLVVTSGADTQDVTQGDGVCADASGACTLRAAVNEANAWPGPDSITVAPGVALAPLTLGALFVEERVNINGNAATVSGSSAGVFVQYAGKLSLDHLTIQRAKAGNGAGLQAHGDVVITRTVFGGVAPGQGNQAGSNGGAIDHEGRGSLSVSQTTFYANQAGAAGGAVYLGPGGVGTISDSTFTQNQVVLPPPDPILVPLAGGGAIADVGAALHVSDSTLSANLGGAILHHGGTTTVTSSTLSGNGLGPTLRADGAGLTVKGSILDPASGGSCAGPVTSDGYDLSSDATCHLTQPGDQENVAPLLGGLAANGGSTRTQLPFLDSPAVDAIPVGTPSLCTSATPADQRGVVRPQGPACDIGAVEGSSTTTAAPVNLVVDTAIDGRDATPGDGVCDDGTGHCPLRAAIDEANAHPATANTITIASGVDPTLTRAGANEDANAVGDLDVTGTLTIDGNGATVDAAHLDNGFDVHTGSLTLRNLTVLNASGAEVNANGDVTLEHVKLSGATGAIGGGVVTKPGTNLVMTDSVVSDNHPMQFSGGLTLTGRATIERSTISGNSSNSTGGIQTGLLGQGPGGEVTIEDSTVTGNFGTTTINSNAEASGIAANSVVHLIRSTIASNNNVGIDVAAFGAVDVSGSILQTDYGPVCQLGTFNPSLVSKGGNVGTDASCFLTGPFDRPSANPELGVLADNGGPTPTRMVIAGSPAIDLIPSGTTGLCDGAGLVDQRGVTRPQGAGCDAGAVEGSGPVTAPLDLTVDTAADTHDLHPGDGVCDDGTGHCSLRAAIDETNAFPTADHIQIAPGVNPTLSIAGTGDADNRSGDLNIFGDLSIDGGGATLNAAGGVDRAIAVFDHTVSISSLTVTGGGGGASVFAAGIYARGALTLHDVTITGNHAGNVVGGLDVTGTLTMSNSTVSGNVSDSTVAGIEVTGAGGTISDSTISGNTTPGSVGAIAAAATDLRIERSTITGNTAKDAAALQGGGTTELIDSTVTGNTATNGSVVSPPFSGQLHILASTIGGDAAVQEIGASPNITLADTVVAANGSTLACSGPVTSAGWNLATDATCGLTQASDHQGVDPLLGALANNGGPTLTRLPAPTSPLINQIPVGTPGLCDGTIATDQRGVARPQGPACDIGSVEQ